MFSDLRQFEYAKVSCLIGFNKESFNGTINVAVFVLQEFIGSGDAKNVKHLIKQQAEWAKSSNDPRAAA